MKILLIFLLFFTFSDSKTLKELASSILLVGFNGYTVPKFLKKYRVAGVILFSKNIKNPIQLKKLTSDIKKIQPNILIAIDEEGGYVERLKKRKGFKHFLSAKMTAQKGEKFAKKQYANMAKLLHDNGINLNLAPDVDLEINHKNPIIAKYNRSFSKNPYKVIKYANIFINEMKKQRVFCCLKHYPGHGSSKSDSHKGFVDVSDTWEPKELLPFMKIKSDFIMTAHIYNKKLDKNYPATLSYKINTILLRKKLGFKGVLISDDLQMGAISKNYSFKKAIELTLNSGVDILLIGNFLDKPIKIDKIVDTIVELIKEGRVKKERLEDANNRINRLFIGI